MRVIKEAEVGMAEVMTVEAILEADWLLQGYWTKPRFPIQTATGSRSDIDVLAYAPVQISKANIQRQSTERPLLSRLQDKYVRDGPSGE
jgi:hypothetical protein